MSSNVFFDNAAELATLSVTWKNAAGTPTDATTSLVVTAPDNTQTTFTTFTHTANSGIYAKDVPCSMAGEWMGAFVASGALSDVSVVRWTVFDADAVLYCSPESLESRLEMSTATRADIEGAIRSVCGWIDEWCGDFFGRVTATRTGEASNPYRFDLFDANIGSLVSVTTLKTDPGGDGTFEAVWTADVDYQLQPYNPSRGRETKPYTKIQATGSQYFPWTNWAYGNMRRRDNVQIAGVFGWPAIPDPVREAALLQSSRVFRRKHSSDGVFGGSADFPALRVGTQLDPDVRQLLAPYCRYPAMVG